MPRVISLTLIAALLTPPVSALPAGRPGAAPAVRAAVLPRLSEDALSPRELFTHRLSAPIPKKALGISHLKFPWIWVPAMQIAGGWVVPGHFARRENVMHMAGQAPSGPGTPGGNSSKDDPLTAVLGKTPNWKKLPPKVQSQILQLNKKGFAEQPLNILWAALLQLYQESSFAAIDDISARLTDRGQYPGKQVMGSFKAEDALPLAGILLSYAQNLAGVSGTPAEPPVQGAENVWKSRGKEWAIGPHPFEIEVYPRPRTRGVKPVRWKFDPDGILLSDIVSDPVPSGLVVWLGGHRSLAESLIKEAGKYYHGKKSDLNDMGQFTYPLFLVMYMREKLNLLANPVFKEFFDTANEMAFLTWLESIRLLIHTLKSRAGGVDYGTLIELAEKASGRPIALKDIQQLNITLMKNTLVYRMYEIEILEKSVPVFRFYADVPADAALSSRGMREVYELLEKDAARRPDDFVRPLEHFEVIHETAQGGRGTFPVLFFDYPEQELRLSNSSSLRQPRLLRTGNPDENQAVVPLSAEDSTAIWSDWLYRLARLSRKARPDKEGDPHVWVSRVLGTGENCLTAQKNEAGEWHTRLATNFEQKYEKPESLVQNVLGGGIVQKSLRDAPYVPEEQHLPDLVRAAWNGFRGSLLIPEGFSDAERDDDISKMFKKALALDAIPLVWKKAIRIILREKGFIGESEPVNVPAKGPAPVRESPPKPASPSAAPDPILPQKHNATHRQIRGLIPAFMKSQLPALHASSDWRAQDELFTNGADPAENWKKVFELLFTELRAQWLGARERPLTPDEELRLAEQMDLVTAYLKRQPGQLNFKKSAAENISAAVAAGYELWKKGHPEFDQPEERYRSSVILEALLSAWRILRLPELPMDLKDKAAPDPVQAFLEVAWIVAREKLGATLASEAIEQMGVFAERMVESLPIPKQQRLAAAQQGLSRKIGPGVESFRASRLPELEEEEARLAPVRAAELERLRLLEEKRQRDRVEQKRQRAEAREQMARFNLIHEIRGLVEMLIPIRQSEELSAAEQARVAEESARQAAAAVPKPIPVPAAVSAIELEEANRFFEWVQRELNMHWSMRRQLGEPVRAQDTIAGIRVPYSVEWRGRRLSVFSMIPASELPAGWETALPNTNQRVHIREIRRLAADPRKIVLIFGLVTQPSDVQRPTVVDPHAPAKPARPPVQKAVEPPAPSKHAEKVPLEEVERYLREHPDAVAKGQKSGHKPAAKVARVATPADIFEARVRAVVADAFAANQDSAWNQWKQANGRGHLEDHLINKFVNRRWYNFQHNGGPVLWQAYGKLTQIVWGLIDAMSGVLTDATEAEADALLNHTPFGRFASRLLEAFSLMQSEIFGEKPGKTKIIISLKNEPGWPAIEAAVKELGDEGGHFLSVFLASGSVSLKAAMEILAELKENAAVGEYLTLKDLLNAGRPIETLHRRDLRRAS